MQLPLLSAADVHLLLGQSSPRSRRVRASQTGLCPPKQEALACRLVKGRSACSIPRRATVKCTKSVKLSFSIVQCSNKPSPCDGGRGTAEMQEQDEENS